MAAPLCALGACAGDGADVVAPADAPSCSCSTLPEAGVPHDSGEGGTSADADADLPDARTQPLLDLQAPREMRGLWVATVSNLDFPLGTPDAAQARLQIAEIAERARQAGLNALFFQVRPESDALYRSNVEPWSRYLTGEQGRDPGYDPLALVLEEAHARGLEVHAWLNPYRAVANASNKDQVTAGHITKVLPSAAVTYNGAVVMDPSNTQVREWVLRVIDDLLGRYAVDGLHYDDYFYPYPASNNAPFPDDAQYTAYVSGGGTLSKVDWRVRNVNLLVEGTHRLVAERYPSVRFGISPFGIHRPDPSLGITGLDAYAQLACDAPHWLAEGWTDYVAPQLYWPSTLDGQAFGTLAGFWAQQIRGETEVYLGHGLHKYGSSTMWSFQEMITQVAIGRGLRESGYPGMSGSLFFTAHDLAPAALVGQFASSLFPTPALPPTLPRAARLSAVAPPQVSSVQGRLVSLAADAEPMAFRALYTRDEAGAWHLDHLLSGATTEFEIPPGDVAVANLRRGAVQSQAVLLEATPGASPP